jgi:molybdenum cofactor cytidylyltransferase
MIAGNDITALILCAGRSSRMGNLKPLLPLGKDNFIERSINLFRRVDIKDILIVLGHEAQKIITFLDGLNVRWVLNDNYDRGMFSSIQTGVRKLDENSGAFFLHPADIPFVHADTLQFLMQAFETGKTDVCRPCYLGRPGHPPLVSTALTGAISEFNGAGGMRAVFARYREKTLDIDCHDPGILMDIDTPEDYEKALKTFSSQPNK